MEKEKNLNEKSSKEGNESNADNSGGTLPVPQSPKVTLEEAKTDSPKVHNNVVEGTDSKKDAADGNSKNDAADGNSQDDAVGGKTDTPRGNEAGTEIKEEDGEKTVTEGNVDEIEGITEIREIEEPVHPPTPEIQYTLETVSEEIDKFISASSSAKDDENASVDIPGFVIEKFMDLLLDKISKHEVSSSSSGEGKIKWSQMNEDETVILEAVNRVSRLEKSLCETLKPDSENQTHAILANGIGGIHQRAMAYLEEEFRSILEYARNSDHPNYDKKSDQSKDPKKQEQSASSQESEQSAEDPEIIFPGYSSDVVSNLSKIAKELILGGYEYECCEVYLITRRNAFDDSLNKLGFEKLSMDEVQKMQWEALEREIATWCTTFKECATVYFAGERKLAEAVFSDYPSISASLFSRLTRRVVMTFLNFVEAVAMTKKSAEKLFKVLDIYEALRDNLPTLDVLYPDECAQELKAESLTARIRLGETAICMFCELENSIKCDTGKNTVPGGAVHPLTRYTMNYLKYACEYKDTLEQVFKDHSKIERADSTSRPKTISEGDEQNFDDSRHTADENDHAHSPFSNQLMKVMDLLDSNLESKSKMYKDVSLSCIFMMNNGRYILQKIKGASEIHDVMGDTWCRKKSSDLRNYHKGYQRETWTRLLGCLAPDGLMNHGKVIKPVLKEKFKSFNAMFDEIHKTQSSWVVSDEQLQSELRVSISAVVIPAYRSFLGRFSQYLDPGRQTEKYIKYQPEDIETFIDELFDGNPASATRRRT